MLFAFAKLQIKSEPAHLFSYFLLTLPSNGTWKPAKGSRTQTRGNTSGNTTFWAFLSFSCIAKFGNGKRVFSHHSPKNVKTAKRLLFFIKSL